MNRLSILEVLREVWQLAGTRDLTMAVHVGDRNPDSRGMRYIVRRAGEPLCCVKRLPISGPFDVQSLLATQKAIGSLSVAKAPQVLGWTQDDQSFFVVEQFVKDGVRLDDAVRRGMMSRDAAQELLANIIGEVYSKPLGAADAKADRNRVTAAIEASDLSSRQKGIMTRRVFDSLPPVWHAPVWTNRDFMPQNVLLSEGQAYLVDFDLSCKTGLLGMDVMRVEFYTDWKISFWPDAGAARGEKLTELLFLVLEQNLQAVIAGESHSRDWKARNGPRISVLAEEVLGPIAVAGETAPREKRPVPGPLPVVNQSVSEPIVSTNGETSRTSGMQAWAWNLKRRLKSGVHRLTTMRPGLGALARDARELRFGSDSDWRSMSNGEFKYWIEIPGHWTLPQKLTTVSGWCFSPHGPISGMRAVVNGEVCEAFYGGDRPDVKAALNPQPGTAKVGFAVQCPVRWGYNEIVLEARREERWIPVSRSLQRAAYFPLIRPQTKSSYEQYVELERRELTDRTPEYVAKSAAFSQRPLISVVVPVFKTEPELLTKAVDSVRRQIYDRWELILVDDASELTTLTKLLDGLAADERIRVHVRTERGNISAATNDGIALAKGEWIAFLDHDDELAADALYYVVERINRKPNSDVIYTDQDKIDTEERRWEPFFKPDWSPEFLRGVMYLGHLMVARTSLVRELGGCDSRFDGVQDYELALRMSERTNRIEHIPRVLYHWRAIAGSVAANGSAKAGIDSLQERAVQAHVDRVGIGATARAERGHRVRLTPARREIYPKISILIPTRDKPELIGRCLKTLFAATSYPNFEVLVGDNETRDPEALKILASHPVKRIPLAGGFHFARFNNVLAAQAAGEYLMLLNNDTEIVQADWLDQLLLYAQEEDVGAAGAVLTYGDGTVQHAGIVLGPRGTADHVMRGFPADCDGYMGSLACTREVTAVTAAALMVSRRKFQLLGGLCERYQRHYDDLDFCLRLRSRGLRNVCVATARLVHHESRSRGDKYDFTDRILLLDRWESLIDQGDAFYNPNFDRSYTDYRVGLGGVPR